MNPNTPLPSPSKLDPIEGLSNCHASIVARLEALDRLPELVDAVIRARHTAEDCLQFFDKAIKPHHQDEERELIPAVLTSAEPGEERARVETLAKRLIDEHRKLESLWGRLRPQLKRIAAGHAEALDAAAIGALVADYKAHASFEETDFLPLAAEILGRESLDLAALGLSIHIRHSRDSVQPYV